MAVSPNFAPKFGLEQEILVVVGTMRPVH